MDSRAHRRNTDLTPIPSPWKSGANSPARHSSTSPCTIPPSPAISPATPATPPGPNSLSDTTAPPICATARTHIRRPRSTRPLFSTGGIVRAERLHGIDMSYTNYLDADAAWRVVSDFPDAAVAMIKHTNPCGLGRPPPTSQPPTASPSRATPSPHTAASSDSTGL